MNEKLNKQNLLETIEQIRSDKFPEIPADLLKQVLEIQSSEILPTQKVKQIRELINNQTNNTEDAEN